MAKKKRRKKAKVAQPTPKGPETLSERKKFLAEVISAALEEYVSICLAQENERLLRLEEVLRLLQISESTWKAGVKAGRFPPPIKIGRANRWRRSDILAFIAGMWQIKEEG